MPELSISSSYSLLALFVSIIAAAGLSFFTYQTTIPPLVFARRLRLMALRTLGLFVLFFLIGQPLLSLLVRTTEPPKTVVLIDNSRSMTIHDRRGDRAAELRSLLHSPSLQRLGASTFALFDSRTRFLSSFAVDSVTLNGEATDLAGALEAVQKRADAENIQGILLVSDGNSTNGSSPLFETPNLRIPIFAVGIGDTSEQRDLAVRRVLTNAVAYAGTRVPANVTIRSSGYSGQRVEVTLTQGSTVLDRKFLSLQEGTREYPLTLEYTPEREGTQKFTVEVSRLPDELTDQNNRSSFFTKVLKSKMNVVLIAGAPGPDVAFIVRSLGRDQTVALSAYVERKDGGFYQRALSPDSLNNADCIVLVGYPSAASPDGTLNQVARAVDAGKPLLFVESRTMEFSRLTPLEPNLPFTIERVSAEEVQSFISIPENQKINPLLNVPASGSQDPWTSLPPLFKTQSILRAKPESEQLAFTRIQNVRTNDPLLLSRSVNHRRSVALLGYGLWRWNMLSDAGSRTADVFLSNCIRWLTTRDDNRRVRVSPVREFFTSQEPAEFSGQIYDESLQPLDDAAITLSVSRGNETTELTMTPLGHGQYEGRLEGLREGDYQYKAVARSGETVLGRDQGTFSVGGSNIEFQNTRTNALLLRQLALRTGGAYFESDQIDRIPVEIQARPKYQPREVVHATEHELWNLQWSLLTLVLIFSTEWFFRKRNGML